ncbi:TIM barrel protein [Paenibacillus sp. RC67]|uniref:TIM barrel protein n=1 Tax=Paenibacillus sp. RC67 TaxID=3039392 RepID=UPI0024AC9075|nr:TIM barrel protein [Paenibacillus sp. RC67]
MSTLQTNEGNVSLIVQISSSGGGLQEAIDAAGAAYDSIQSLSITEGTLNTDDCSWIQEHLVHLIDLEIGGTADFENSMVPKSAFNENKVLQNVKIDHAVGVCKMAFNECHSLVSIDLPQVESVESHILTNCKSLQYANLPKLRSMDSRAFYGCAALKSLHLGEEPPELLGRGYWFKHVYTATIFVPTEASIQKYRETYELADFKIKAVGDDSVDEEDGIDPFANLYEPISTSHYLKDSRKGSYYTGDYKIGLNLYSFSHNLASWLKGSTKGSPPIDTMQAIKFAKEAGFDAVDVTSYYIPGYDNHTMPTKSDEEILEYAKAIKSYCEELGIDISGTGVQNDFADPNPARRALDLERIKYWIDVAAVMGAPVMRVFSGLVPRDILKSDWETIAKDRIAPALRECAEYGSDKGVRIGLQNHGDMTATVDQIIRILQWVDHPNIGIINDTGYFRTFRNHTGLGYDWYSDIEAALPYTVNFQVKKKPAGQETDIPVNLAQIFTAIRYSNYRGYIPIELLWQSGDAGHPKDLKEPPFEEIRYFLAQVKAAANYTKSTGPSSLAEK